MRWKFLFLLALLTVLVITTTDAGKKNKKNKNDNDDDNNGKKNKDKNKDNKNKGCKVEKCAECLEGQKKNCAVCEHGFQLIERDNGHICVKDHLDCGDLHNCAKVASTVSLRYGPIEEQDIQDEFTLENTIKVTHAPNILIPPKDARKNKNKNGKKKNNKNKNKKPKKNNNNNTKTSDQNSISDNNDEDDNEDNDNGKTQPGTRFSVIETSLFSVDLDHGNNGHKIQFMVTSKGKGDKGVHVELVGCGSQTQCDEEGKGKKKNNMKKKKKRVYSAVLTPEWEIGQTVTAKVHAKKIDGAKDMWHLQCNVTVKGDTTYALATYKIKNHKPMEKGGFRSGIVDTLGGPLINGYRFMRRAEYMNPSMIRPVGSTMTKKELKEVQFFKSRDGKSSFAHDLTRAGYNATTSSFFLSTGDDHKDLTHNISSDTSLTVQRDHSVIRIIST